MTFYFDGSEGVDDHGTTWLTLAGLMASDAVWKKFRSDWSRMLDDRFPPAPYTHMSDLHTHNGPFRKTLGWEKDRVDALMHSALGVIQAVDKRSSFAAGVRVNLDAHRTIASKCPSIPSPHHICVFSCMKVLATHFYEQHFGRIPEVWRLYFDRGEKFLHPFKTEWQQNKTRGRVKTNLFWDMIEESPSALDMRHEPCLQAADIFAWSFTRSLLSKHRPWRLLSRFLLPRPGESDGLWPCATGEYGELELMQVVQKQQEVRCGVRG